MYGVRQLFGVWSSSRRMVLEKDIGVTNDGCEPIKLDVMVPCNFLCVGHLSYTGCDGIKEMWSECEGYGEAIPSRSIYFYCARFFH